jgi:hypothetical protein
MLAKKISATIALIASQMSSAHAASQTEPGFTTGVGVYQAAPEGLYFIGIPQYGVRSTAPSVDSFFFSPFIYYQSPFQIAGAKVSFYTSPTVVDVVYNGHNTLGWYNIYVASQLTWDLGGGFGTGFRLGGYIPTSGPTASNFGTVEARTGVTYSKDGIMATANFIYGMPTPDQGTGNMTAPNYFNVDLTALKYFNKFSVGIVGFGSTDVNRPYASYAIQSQFALGAVLGYDFDRVSVQLKLTSDVAEHNYGGYEKRAWMNIIVPLWMNLPPKDVTAKY